jgi:hypothetical protein
LGAVCHNRNYQRALPSREKELGAVLAKGNPVRRLRQRGEGRQPVSAFAAGPPSDYGGGLHDWDTGPTRT